MIANNLRLVEKVWKDTTHDVNVATRKTRDEMMNALTQLAKETIKGKRPVIGTTASGRKIYEKAISGLPPMNRSGKLRGSIKGERFDIGFANYTAVVGPTIVYARRVELGGGNWKPGTRFPYMEPAYLKFRMSVAPQIIGKNFRRFR